MTYNEMVLKVSSVLTLNYTSFWAIVAMLRSKEFYFPPTVTMSILKRLTADGLILERIEPANTADKKVKKHFYKINPEVLK